MYCHYSFSGRNCSCIEWDVEGCWYPHPWSFSCALLCPSIPAELYLLVSSMSTSLDSEPLGDDFNTGCEIGNSVRAKSSCPTTLWRGFLGAKEIKWKRDGISDSECNSVILLLYDASHESPVSCRDLVTKVKYRWMVYWASRRFSSPRTESFPLSQLNSTSFPS